MQPTYLVVIPLYNHASGILGVIEGVFAACRDGGFSDTAPTALLVVDDGSTDQGAELVKNLCCPRDDAMAVGEPALHLLRHTKNAGKGVAILSAAAWAAEHGFSHIITMDADGQHFASDLAALCQISQAAPEAIIVGSRDFNTANVPASSRFGRAFSGFWMKVQTGVSVADMQSGFRVYPVAILRAIKFTEKRFAFELEVLVRAAWSGFSVQSLPVRVHYPPASERVSHFRKFYDNFRISFLNTRLTIRALIPLPFTRREQDATGDISVLHPLTSLRRLLEQDNTPTILAYSTFLAVTVSCLPLIGLQSIVILLGISRLKLNRVWTLSVHHALWSPLTIPMCIEAGYFLRHGSLLTDLSWATLAEQAHYRLLEWVLGGMFLGPILGLLGGALVYGLARGVKKGLRRSPELEIRSDDGRAA